MEIIPSFNHAKKIIVSLKVSFSRFTDAYTFHVALNINVFINFNLALGNISYLYAVFQAS